MAKIESGTMAVDLEAVPLAQVRRELEHTFLQVAQQKELGFTVTIDPGVPQAIHTDAKRLQQVLNNLVSNACKFTERGSVEVRIAPAPAGWSTDHATLNRVTEVIAFAVRDTGIGIAPEKLRLVFEPFQQADMGTAGSMAGRGWGCPSAARSPISWAAKSASRAPRARGVRSPSTCRRVGRFTSLA